MTDFKNRHKYLGASEVGQALGLSKWGTPHDLWLQKTLRSPRTAHKNIFDRGHEMEPVLARMLKDKHGFHLTGSQREYKRKETPWLVSHVDGMLPEVTDPGLLLGSTAMMAGGVYPAGKGVVEFKAPGMHVTNRVKASGFDATYIAQLQTNIYNAGTQWGVLVLLDYDAWGPICAWLARDNEMIKAILSKGQEFWNHVERDDEPPIVVNPEPLPNFFPGGAKELDSPEAKVLARNLQLADDKMKNARAEYEDIKATMLNHMREREESSKIIIPLEDVIVRVTDSLVEGRETIQGKDLLAWTGNLCDAYLNGETDIVKEMVGKFVNRTTPLFVKKGSPYVRTTINYKERT